MVRSPRILLLTVANRGHINPYIGIAQWIRRLGGTASWAFLGHGDAYVDQLEAQGVEVIRSGNSAAKMVRDPVELWNTIQDPARNKRRFEAYLEGSDEEIERLRSAIRSARPDVIALDASVYITVVAALCERIPFINVCTTLVNVAPATLAYPYLHFLEELAPVRDALFARHHVAMTFHRGEAVSAIANLALTTAEVVAEPPETPPFTLVGPSLAPGARGDEPALDWTTVVDGRPIVYISFGSMIFWQPERLAMLARAAVDAGAQPLLSAGTLSSDQAFCRMLPSGTVVLPYVPQMEALSRAAAFVSHGGANSFMEGIQHGVPMLILPMCHDQPVQAYFATRAGFGLSADPNELDHSAAVTIVRRLITDETLRVRAAHVQRSYRAQDGARAAATLLIEAAI